MKSLDTLLSFCGCQRLHLPTVGVQTNRWIQPRRRSEGKLCVKYCLEQFWLVATSSKWKASSSMIDHCTRVWLCLWTAEITWEQEDGNPVKQPYHRLKRQPLPIIYTFLWRTIRLLSVGPLFCSWSDLSTSLSISSWYTVGHYNEKKNPKKLHIKKWNCYHIKWQNFICHLWNDSADTTPEDVVMTDASVDICHILEIRYGSKKD